MRFTDGTAIADAFTLGEVHKFTHVADGMMARIWRLDSTSGSYAVKEFRDFVDVGELASRVEASTQLANAARESGVVGPRAVRDSAGELVGRVGIGDDSDAVYASVSKWIDGRPLQLTRDVSDAAAWLGRTAATIECAPDPPAAQSLDPWLMNWLTTVPAIFEWQTALEQSRRADKAWAELLSARLGQLTRLAESVTPATDARQSVLHPDMQPKNVLVTSTGFALLDWNDAARCSVDRILARTLIEWFTPGGVRPDLITGFMRAYRADGGRGVIEDVTAFGYAVAAFLNYLYETIQSELTSDRASGDSSGELVAALTRPLDTSTLEDVLAVVREIS
ncbi:hypothetical protein GCM10027613_00350 [Microlunatus endophyticus]